MQRGEADLVTEGFEAAMSRRASFRAGAAGVEVGAEIGVGLAGGHDLPDDH
jgi:hypothetical protein